MFFLLTVGHSVCMYVCILLTPSLNIISDLPILEHVYFKGDKHKLITLVRRTVFNSL